MAAIDLHPTVVKMRERERERASGDGPAAAPLDAAWLRELCLQAGADDVGFVELDRPSLAGERANALDAFPASRTFVSILRRMGRENIRSPARSIANVEFHHAGRELEDTARRIIGRLAERGVRAMYPAVGFPMEADRFPARMWVISHKLVAVEAGLGHMGIHRNLIHPRFGNFILLETILIDRAVTGRAAPLDYNPCLECKLCVAACPVGAIGPDGYFNFSACLTHNYREFVSGFTTYMEDVADSKDRFDLRSRVSDSESVSWWQSLSFGANYKAAYCMAVCPAGEDVIGPYLDDKPNFLAQVVRPLTEKSEDVYVVAESDAEAHVKKRFPRKRPRRVASPARPTSAAGFLRALPLVFNRHRSEGVAAVFHFTFTGDETLQATVTIRDKILRVEDGLRGKADLQVTADARSWVAFLRKERGIVPALLTRRIRVKGGIALLQAFARCFPS